jgi:outer membrane lipoprotein SlyB
LNADNAFGCGREILFDNLDLELRSLYMKKAMILTAAMILLTTAVVPAFADLKVRSRQTMGGQTFENTSYIKGKRQRSETMNGAMVNITQCDLKRAIQLNPASRTFVVSEFGDIEPATRQDNGTVAANQPLMKGGRVITTIDVKDTGERKQMFGYQARRLVITMETESTPDACNQVRSKMETDGWYIDFADGFDCGQASMATNVKTPTKGGCQDKYEYKQTGSGKRGFAIYEKMTMFDESGRETMVMVNEVIELSKATLDNGLFEVPEGYRQVSDASQMYAASPATAMSSASEQMTNTTNSMPLPNRPQGQIATDLPTGYNASSTTEKKPGVVRIGLAAVKTGSVGQGITAADLAMAVQNTLIEYLKMPNLEVVVLEARLPAAIESEAKEKDCDLIVNVTANHKKGGGGGMFGSALGSAIGRTGIGHTGSAIGNIAGQMATQAIVSATSVSSQMKSKDELTLDVKMNKPSATAVLTKQFKAKAKSDGEDIISAVIEQAAQAIVDALGQ